MRENEGRGKMNVVRQERDSDYTQVDRRAIETAIHLQRKLISDLTYGTVSKGTIDQAQQKASAVLVELKLALKQQMELERKRICSHPENTSALPSLALR
jgi:phenylalanyl-tRNA synthetase beta subunit